MGHTTIESHPRSSRAIRIARAVLLAGCLLATFALAPAGADAATLHEPVADHHFDHLDVAPMVIFSPATDERPRWVLLASDAKMTRTVRYCRQFVWAQAAGQWAWGCNKWATGVDQFGNDKLVPLEPGATYHWQVVSAGEAEGDPDELSEVRAFTVDAKPATPSVAEVSEQVHGTAFDDGSQLNLGAAAFVNSKVRVRSIASKRLATYAFRIRVQHVGTIDTRRSWIRVRSKAGIRYLPVRRAGDGAVIAIWRLNPGERRLRSKRYAYQAFLRSTVNAALVKSPGRVVVIRKRPRR